MPTERNAALEEDRNDTSRDEDEEDDDAQEQYIEGELLEVAQAGTSRWIIWIAVMVTLIVVLMAMQELRRWNWCVIAQATNLEPATLNCYLRMW